MILLILADAISYKKSCTSDLFPGIHKFVSIKSNVLKLDTAQKVYSVNKRLFLGVFSSPWFTYMGRY